MTDRALRNVDVLNHSINSLTQRLTTGLFSTQDCLRTLVETIEFLQLAHQLVEHSVMPREWEGTRKAVNPQRTKYLTSPDDQFAYILARTKDWMCWIDVMINRVQARVDLMYNVFQQQDNRVNVRIASLTSEIAVETQKDSSSMTTYVPQSH